MVPVASSKIPKKPAPKSSLFEKILENKPYEKVVRDPVSEIWYESETGTVFDPVSRVAIGVRTEGGTIRQLTASDLELARERGWKTVFVENLKQPSASGSGGPTDDDGARNAVHQPQAVESYGIL